MAVAVSGCTVRPQGDYEEAARHVQSATGQQTVYQPDDDALVDSRVAGLLAGGLSADRAAQIALLNSRKLQAMFYEIGMARADVVQSGLLSNPTLALSLGFPDGGGVSKFALGLTQNIADAWQIPARCRVSEQTLERTILEVAREANVIVTDAKTAYYRALQADRKREIATESVELSRQVLGLTLARQAAGAGSEVDVNLAKSEVQDGELSLRTATLEAFEARTELAMLLSLTNRPDELQLAEPLPEPPEWTLSDEKLFALASESRLDVQAARSAAGAAEARIREEILKIFPTLEVGVEFERKDQGKLEDRDLLADSVYSSVSSGEPSVELSPKPHQANDTLLGPTLGMELPIFDQNQGGIARAKYSYEQSRKQLDGLRRRVLQEVRMANARARTACDIVHFYRDEVLPVREASLELSRIAYQSGRTALLNVLEIERAVLSARAGYVDSLRASAAAVVELERASGQPIAKILAAMQGEGASSGPSAPQNVDLEPAAASTGETKP
jgi:cobalt-zinc-cadmium efflux system outer membrane protein